MFLGLIGESTTLPCMDYATIYGENTWWWFDKDQKSLASIIPFVPRLSQNITTGRSTGSKTFLNSLCNALKNIVKAFNPISGQYCHFEPLDNTRKLQVLRGYKMETLAANWWKNFIILFVASKTVKHFLN